VFLLDKILQAPDPAILDCSNRVHFSAPIRIRTPMPETNGSGKFSFGGRQGVSRSSMRDGGWMEFLRTTPHLTIRSIIWGVGRPSQIPAQSFRPRSPSGKPTRWLAVHQPPAFDWLHRHPDK